MQFLVKALLLVTLLSCHHRVIYGQAANISGTFNQNGSGTHLWQTGLNWGDGTGTEWPGVAGASATFNGATAAVTGTTPARSIQMANGTLTTVTVGSITVNLDTNNDKANNMQRDTRFTAGTSGRLVFDSTSGPATLNITGNGDSRFSFEAGGTSAVNLLDDLVVTVSNTAYSGAANGFTTGAFEMVSVLFGPGGFTKEGPGMMTFAGSSTQQKLYTGPTTFNAGWVKMSLNGRPTGTSSVTINSGATMELFSTSSTTSAFSYTLGADSNVPLKLNGTGSAIFPGVIRPDRNAIGRNYTITNNTELQSDSLIHIQQIAREDTNHSLTLSGVVSGAGRLTQTAANSDAALGLIVLTNANTYSGGTTLNGGRMQVSGATATFGTGDVFVLDPGTALNAGPGASFGIARLIISQGVANAIADNKQLSIAGGFTDDALPASFAELQTDVNEVVGSLKLGGIDQLNGRTYGSMSSSAMVKNDEFFSGTGMVAVGLLGDYDGSQTVDAGDYVVWRQAYSADTNMYDVWRANFGNTAPGAAAGNSLQQSSAVPEPSTLGLAALCGTFLLATRRRRFAGVA
jgi:autotransporter-associated beta strand protein